MYLEFLICTKDPITCHTICTLMVGEGTSRLEGSPTFVALKGVSIVGMCTSVSQQIMLPCHARINKIENIETECNTDTKSYSRKW